MSGASGGRSLAFGDTFDALIEAARDGSSWAWQQLYDWLAPAVGGYLRVQGARDVDDLTSEVWIGVFKGISTFRGGEAQFRSWVFVIAHRRMCDERRRAARTAMSFDAVEPLDGPSASSAEVDALQRMAVERVEAVCACLTAEQRDVVLLRIVVDLTIEQIAQVLGRSEGAVKALQRRAFDSIRRNHSWQGVPL